MGNQRRKYAKRFAFGEKADPGKLPPVALLLLAAALQGCRFSVLP